MKPATHLVAAAGGAALALVVTDGHAEILDASGEPVATAAVGERVVVSRPAPSPSPAPRVVLAPVAEETARATPSEADRLRFENASLRGQLELREGKPVAWPDQVPAPLEPDAYVATLQDHLPDGFAVLAADCAEYPCIGWVHAAGAPDADWEPDARAFYTNVLEGGVLGDSPQIWTWPDVRRDGSGSDVLAAVALMPEGKVDRALSTRLNHRVTEGTEPVWVALGRGL